MSFENIKSSTKMFVKRLWKPIILVIVTVILMFLMPPLFALCVNFTIYFYYEIKNNKKQVSFFAKNIKYLMAFLTIGLVFFPAMHIIGIIVLLIFNLKNTLFDISGSEEELVLTSERI